VPAVAYHHPPKIVDRYVRQLRPLCVLRSILSIDSSLLQEVDELHCLDDLVRDMRFVACKHVKHLNSSWNALLSIAQARRLALKR
jgi:hypothetical protein